MHILQQFCAEGSISGPIGATMMLPWAHLQSGNVGIGMVVRAGIAVQAGVVVSTGGS